MTKNSLKRTAASLTTIINHVRIGAVLIMNQGNVVAHEEPRKIRCRKNSLNSSRIRY